MASPDRFFLGIWILKFFVTSVTCATILKINDTKAENIEKLDTSRYEDHHLPKLTDLLQRLDDKLTSMAMHVTRVEHTVDNIQNRAHVWDTIQHHVVSWSEQMKSMDRKVDIINSGQQKLALLEVKLNVLSNLEYTESRILSRLTSIEETLSTLEDSAERMERVLGSIRNERPAAARNQGLYGEFAARGVFSTLKALEARSARSMGLLQQIFSEKKRSTSPTQPGSKLLIRCTSPLGVGDVVKDIASKIDLIYDKLAVDDSSEEGDDKKIVDNGRETIKNGQETREKERRETIKDGFVDVKNKGIEDLSYSKGSDNEENKSRKQFINIEEHDGDASLKEDIPQKLNEEKYATENGDEDWVFDITRIANTDEPLPAYQDQEDGLNMFEDGTTNEESSIVENDKGSQRIKKIRSNYSKNKGCENERLERKHDEAGKDTSSESEGSGWKEVTLEVEEPGQGKDEEVNVGKTNCRSKRSATDDIGEWIQFSNLTTEFTSVISNVKSKIKSTLNEELCKTFVTKKIKQFNEKIQESIIIFNDDVKQLAQRMESMIDKTTIEDIAPHLKDVKAIYFDENDEKQTVDNLKNDFQRFSKNMPISQDKPSGYCSVTESQRKDYLNVFVQALTSDQLKLFEENLSSFLDIFRDNLKKLCRKQAKRWEVVVKDDNFNVSSFIKNCGDPFQANDGNLVAYSDARRFACVIVGNYYFKNGDLDICSHIKSEWRVSGMPCKHNGSIIFQKRTNGAVDFGRSWNDYMWGFGSLKEENWWLGNLALHVLTKTNSWRLDVELMDFDGVKVEANYEAFKVDSLDQDFRLHVGRHSGNAPDSLLSHDMQYFSTFDHRRDSAPSCCPCSDGFTKSGWWFHNCFDSNLNGEHLKKEKRDSGNGVGIIWEQWRGMTSLKETTMSLRKEEIQHTEKEGEEEGVSEYEDP